MTGTTRRRGVVVAGLVVALAAGAGTWALIDLQGGETAAADAHQRTQHATALVTKGDLTDARVFAGTLGYGAPTGVPGAASGTLTWLPKPGQVIHRDEVLYAVDERGVRAMTGTVPLWRTLERGRKGADVRQLNENLQALGYDVATDDAFGPRTERAVRKWQKDRGLTVTGTVTADDVAFVDGDVRVASVTGRLGQPAGGDVIEVTSTRQVVTATVSQRDAERLAVGTAVDVRVNGTGDPMPGEVTDVRPSTAEGAESKVDVSIAFAAGDRQLPAAAAAQIDAKGTTEHDVLSVPVAALVAGPGGSTAVDVVRRDGTTKRVAVRPGFSAAGRIAVTGDVHEGDEVVVPG